MADIIVRDPFYITQSHGQHGLGAAQSLDLRFLIHRQHHRVVWRVEVQPDDVTHLLDKERIVREFECLGAMGLQSKGLKHAVNSGLRQAVGFGCSSNAPVGPGRRRTFHSTSQQGGHFLVGDGARTSWPEFIVEPLNTMLDELW